jgi:hypothetical protein
VMWRTTDRVEESRGRQSMSEILTAGPLTGGTTGLRAPASETWW